MSPEALFGGFILGGAFFGFIRGIFLVHTNDFFEYTSDIFWGIFMGVVLFFIHPFVVKFLTEIF